MDLKKNNIWYSNFPLSTFLLLLNIDYKMFEYKRLPWGENPYLMTSRNGNEKICMQIFFYVLMFFTNIYIFLNDLQVKMSMKYHSLAT